MQSPNHTTDDSDEPPRVSETIIAGRVEDLPPGRCATVELPNGNELALYNVDGEFYATENSCPHHGAPLADGKLCGHVIECGFHGWRFDVRDGRGLTVAERIHTYRVVLEDRLIKIEVRNVERPKV
jgi:3-phenylpropionate/trans-cinnamate dioxygenase ferredoxin component